MLAKFVIYRIKSQQRNYVCNYWRKNDILTWDVSTCRSLLPRGLRRGFMAALLLRLRVRIPPKAWLSVYAVSVACCQVQTGLCVRLVTRTEESYRVLPLLGLRVRIPPKAWLSVYAVSVACCQVQVSASGWSLAERSPTLVGIAGSNPAKGVASCVCCECSVLSGAGLCVRLVTRTEESYRVLPLLGLRVRIPPKAWLSVYAVSVACCQVEVSASGWSLAQRSPTECGVSECDRKASKGEDTTRIRAEESKEIKKCKYKDCPESIQPF